MRDKLYEKDGFEIRNTNELHMAWTNLYATFLVFSS